MKRSAIILAVTVGLAASAAWASDQTKDNKQSDSVTPAQVKKAEVKSSEKHTKAVVTGSYIPQKIRRDGRITDGQSQLIVLDQEIIQRTGAAGLRQVLSSQGIH